MAQLNAILTNEEREALIDKEAVENYSLLLSDLDNRISTELRTNLRLFQQNEPHLSEVVLQQVNRSFDKLLEP